MIIISNDLTPKIIRRSTRPTQYYKISSIERRGFRTSRARQEYINIRSEKRELVYFYTRSSLITRTREETASRFMCWRNPPEHPAFVRQLSRENSPAEQRTFFFLARTKRYVLCTYRVIGTRYVRTGWNFEKYNTKFPCRTL